MPPTTAAAQSCQVIQANISARPSGNKATRPLSYLIRPPSTGPRDMRVPPQPGREASGCAEPQDLANHAETRPTILPAGSIAISITAARPKSVEPAAVATAWISLRSKREVGEYEIDYVGIGIAGGTTLRGEEHVVAMAVPRVHDHVEKAVAIVE